LGELETYRRKRRFDRTPEPAGEASARAKARDANALSFVVQKHAATRLHYDFRLELDGVLKSWAVPKGPSLDPRERHLAVEVEDHPLEYGGFEGIIPKGEYGGGTVIVWDRGTWTPVGDPHEGYKKGKLKLVLDGEKLHGGFTLVRIRNRDAGDDDRTWLLIKEKDAHARADKQPVEVEQASVVSGKTIEQMESEPSGTWHSSRRADKGPGRALRAYEQAKASESPKTKRVTKAPKAARSTAASRSKIDGAARAPMPELVLPQLATLVDDAPEGDEWAHEIKLDGYRIVCYLDRGKVRLVSRRGHDWTARMPELAEAVPALPAEQAILDGEIAVVRADGTTDFQALQNALGSGSSDSIRYLVFDLLYLDGWDLRGAPLRSRKAALARLFEESKHARERAGRVEYSDHVVGRGHEVLEHACRLGLEGIVSKRLDAPYLSVRARTWLKIKCKLRQELVVIGYTDPSGSRTGFGSLLVGYYDRGRLVYAGKVGTGFDAKKLRDLHARLRELEREESPLASRLPKRVPNVHWVEPSLVAEIEFTEWTGDGILRHPSFIALREDRKPEEVVREKTKRVDEVAAPTAAGVTLTNPDRVLYPDVGITKRELAEYYAQVAPFMLPGVSNRVLTLVRCPEGWQKQCFFQKHASEGLSDAIHRIDVEEDDGAGAYLWIDSVEGLLSLVQMGVLEIHTWGGRVDRLEQPDRIVMDLDPAPDVEWSRVVEAARDMRARLRDVGLESYVRTTGGKGLHVVAPVRRKLGWSDVKEFARALALDFVRREPARYTATATKSKRKGKIFVDYLRNGRGATAITSYSTRARAGAPVSTPLSWDELDEDLRPLELDVRSVPKRLASLPVDPWGDIDDNAHPINASAWKELGAPKP